MMIQCHPVKLFIRITSKIQKYKLKVLHFIFNDNIP